jgi:hypothetical protein
MNILPFKRKNADRDDKDDTSNKHLKVTSASVSHWIQQDYNNIIETVCHFLYISEIAQTRLVCTYWNRITHNDSCFSIYQTYEHMCHIENIETIISTTFPHIKSLHTTCMQHTYNIHNILPLPKLLKLTFLHICSNESTCLCPLYLQTYNHITSLDYTIEQGNLKDIVKNISYISDTLTELTIQCGSIAHYANQTHNSILSKLKTLHIQCDSYNSVQNIITCIPVHFHANQLQTLIIDTVEDEIANMFSKSIYLDLAVSSPLLHTITAVIEQDVLCIHKFQYIRHIICRSTIGTSEYWKSLNKYITTDHAKTYLDTITIHQPLEFTLYAIHTILQSIPFNVKTFCFVYHNFEPLQEEDNITQITKMQLGIKKVIIRGHFTESFLKLAKPTFIKILFTNILQTCTLYYLEEIIIDNMPFIDIGTVEYICYSIIKQLPNLKKIILENFNTIPNCVLNNVKIYNL